MSKGVRNGNKGLLICFDKTTIEHLGAMHVGGLARDLGWERTYFAVPDRDYSRLNSIVDEKKTAAVLFSIYTGNHGETLEAIDRLKRKHPEVRTLLGGPHATYFPEESADHVDYVVMSEGFEPLRRILTEMTRPGIVKNIRRFALNKASNYLAPGNGQPAVNISSRSKGSSEKLLKKAQPSLVRLFRKMFGYETPKGIQPMAKTDRISLPDRETLYSQYEEFARSRIKSMIGTTGCPYKCTYCYNSSTPGDLALKPELAKMVAAMMGSKENSGGTRLFPAQKRSIDDLVAEGREILTMWPDTRLIYMQDDVFGADLSWLAEFAERWPKEVGTPFHAQMRWEMARDKKRLELTRKAGGHGLTLAIEAANPIIRKYVLDRDMPDEIMYSGMKSAIDLGFRVRTEQIGMLPYGATPEETPINLEADLGLLALNVDLFRKTGGPTQAWMSIFAPYLRTKLGIYSVRNGFYHGDNNEVSDTFFERSELKFPRRWVGTDLLNKEVQDNPDIWLPEEELNAYKGQGAELRNHFQFFAGIPEGDRLAREYLTSPGEFTYQKLATYVGNHLASFSGRVDRDAERAREMLSRINPMRSYISKLTSDNGHSDGLASDLITLAPYFAAMPKGELAIPRVFDYGNELSEGSLTTPVLSRAVRHHLYDEVLYEVGSIYSEEESSPRILTAERYPAKL
jgi:anaerobic magnesium-protoporphyrin IX monomethyl ester cyclase